MPKDTEEIDDRSTKPNYGDELDQDARAAYAEVAGRIKEASETVEGKSEKTPAEKPVAKDLKEGASDDNRDHKGRFAGKSKSAAKEGEEGSAGQESEAAGKSAADAKAVDPAAKPGVGEPTAGGPPPSFSVKTKAEWAKLPEHVRADIIKREGEVKQGLQGLQEFKDLKPYQDLAQKHNTTIPKALDHFMRMENLLKQNLEGGIATIVQNFGHNREQAAQLFMRMAQKLGGGTVAATNGNTASAQPGADGQPDPLAEALRPYLGPLLQKLTAIEGQHTSRVEADRNAISQSLEKAEAAFKADPANLYFNELEPTMVRLFSSGMVPLTGNHAADIKAAYEMAAGMHPEVREALIEQRLSTKQEAQRKAEQEAADKAKKASRSLTGSRMPGSTTKVRDDAPESNDDVEADVIRAFRQHANA